MSEWKSMKSALKDGTPIWLYHHINPALIYEEYSPKLKTIVRFDSWNFQWKDAYSGKEIHDICPICWAEYKGPKEPTKEEVIEFMKSINGE